MNVHYQAKHANLPWDAVFSTELFDTFKPYVCCLIADLSQLTGRRCQISDEKKCQSLP